MKNSRTHPLSLQAGHAQSKLVDDKEQNTPANDEQGDLSLTEGSKTIERPMGEAFGALIAKHIRKAVLSGLNRYRLKGKAMFTIKTNYEGQGKDVVGKTFKRKRDAIEFLHANGWKEEQDGFSYFSKIGKARPCGMLSYSIMEYVFICKA